ncbi:DUF2938 domain-containing protein [Flavobacterium zepuense]|uniref:DUF2938 domain-containing protein n=1 Tax=Flavobacterium zepuense TaxID=2593302 RepID=A0A552V3X8_9FLAO|nr:DUF2938 domain-containing protein [Flavobacterium zepuense]TRW25161.1 DUF2938 domain-containing protein [Flavobacterium zepuense]
MKAPLKIILAGIVGTSFMTLYSYYRAKKENQQYEEPELLNKLIDRNNAVDVDVNKKHAAGWVAHYGVGMLFVLAYWVLYRRALHSPGPVKVLLVGSASAATAVGAWKIMFSASPNPPDNNRYGYYRQLAIAHLIFTLFALSTYKILDSKTPSS